MFGNRKSKRQLILNVIFGIIIIGIICAYCISHYIEINSLEHIPDDIFGDDAIFRFGFVFMVVPIILIILDVAIIINYFAFGKRAKYKTIFHTIASVFIAVMLGSAIFGVLIYKFDPFSNFDRLFYTSSIVAWFSFVILRFINLIVIIVDHFRRKKRILQKE